MGNFSTVCKTVRPLCLIFLFYGKLLNGMCDVPTFVFSYLVPFETSERPFWRFERLIKLSCSMENRRFNRWYLVILFNGKLLNGLYDGPTVVFSYLVPLETSQRSVWRSGRWARWILWWCTPPPAQDQHTVNLYFLISIQSFRKVTLMGRMTKVRNRLLYQYFNVYIHHYSK